MEMSFQVPAFTSFGGLPRNGIAGSHPVGFCTKHDRRPGGLYAGVLLPCFNRTPLVAVLSSDCSGEGQGWGDQAGGCYSSPGERQQ